MGCTQSSNVVYSMDFTITATGAATDGRHPSISPSNGCLLIVPRDGPRTSPPLTVTCTARVDVIAVSEFGAKAVLSPNSGKYSVEPPLVGFTVLHVGSSGDASQGSVSIVHDTVKYLPIDQMVDRASGVMSARNGQTHRHPTHTFSFVLGEPTKSAAGSSPGCVLVLPFGRGFDNHIPQGVAAGRRCPMPQATVRVSITTDNNSIRDRPIGVVCESPGAAFVSAVSVSNGAHSDAQSLRNHMHSKTVLAVDAAPPAHRLPPVCVAGLAHVAVPMKCVSDDGQHWTRQGTVMSDSWLSPEAERSRVFAVAKRLAELFPTPTATAAAATATATARKPPRGRNSTDRCVGGNSSNGKHKSKNDNRNSCNGSDNNENNDDGNNDNGNNDSGGGGGGGAVAAGELSARELKAVEAAASKRWRLKASPAPVRASFDFAGGQELLLEGAFSNGLASCVVFATSSFGAATHVDLTIEASSLPSGGPGDDKGLALVVLAATDRRHAPTAEKAHVIHRSEPTVDVATYGGFRAHGRIRLGDTGRRSASLPPMEFTAPGQACGLRMTMESLITAGDRCIFPSYLIVPFAPPSVSSKWRLRIRFPKGSAPNGGGRGGRGGRGGGGVGGQPCAFSGATLQSWCPPVALGGLRGDAPAGEPTPTEGFATRLSKASATVPLYAVDPPAQITHQKISRWTTVKGSSCGNDIVVDCFIPSAPI